MTIPDVFMEACLKACGIQRHAQAKACSQEDSVVGVSSPIIMALYNKAGEILEKLEKQKGTIKSLCLADDVADKKRTYALVCESLKYKDVLEIVIKQAGLLEAGKPRLRPSVATVLVYDFLFGRGLQTSGSYKQIVLSHKTRLQAELAKIKIKRKVKDNKDLIPARIRDAVVLPRWIRVNTLVASVEKVIEMFTKLGYRVDSETEPSQLSGKVFRQDKHIPELVMLPSNVDLHDNPLLLDGSIIIQDKASCFPAYILNPPKDSTVIDACAAPGNKTSHLSAIMGNTGKIFAFDMDKRRLGTLKKMTGRARCTNIEPIHGSFLDIDVNDERYRNVEYILLDPSCSGSGIVGRMDHLLDQDKESVEDEADQAASETRIAALADFQKKAILHAMKFPHVKKVVYSTCSKHRQENEDVVQHVLTAQEDFSLADGVFPQWTRRGLPLFSGAEKVIRTEPKEDSCIGFFVALFERQTELINENHKVHIGGKRLAPVEDVHSEVIATTKNAKKRRKKKSNASTEAAA
ncbi:uncharacterized protein SPPG_04242 [Spizellomyces punctatus DAOM BR117]|uniref:SAM-dependent MTase RsmB/NOP-type domain-containing protein n=1 Tax=Spizellomyces punctatus (strain DAOM BR117) TaxID=645134 RepID=A0A0L0HJU2_SPIPD|nr:uncharacterized protein SPPG_04242 [Spizellomyces punctatus DAOM BR117]KND01150.1 hypothetical protein SPPG_04242 [Spizellomyces punctatus DAOM BR117]|eukprot:XP_016609189.1 hypothetical protein SPPG_04242 [Spizellomyces punctatus DAOM BR117]